MIALNKVLFPTLGSPTTPSFINYLSFISVFLNTNNYTTLHFFVKRLEGIKVAAYIILLAVVQGLTEFLPVSSSGHLVLMEQIFGVQVDMVFMSILMHLGTLVAVFVYYRKKIFNLIKKPFSKEVGYLCLSVVPAALFVLMFKDFVTKSFDGSLLAWGFLVSSCMLFVADKVSKKYKGTSPFTYKTALLMGVFEAVAIFPGVSRSGSTLCAGIFSGVDSDEALDFSFLMSIPIILASTFFEIFDMGSAVRNINFSFILIGFFVAFICGLISIKLTINFTKKIKLKYFSIYLLFLAFITFYFV